MNEDKLEQETLTSLSALGYTHIYGPDIAYDGDTPERASYQEIILINRLRRTSLN